MNLYEEKFIILSKNNFTSWTINRYTIDKWMKFEKLFTKKVPVQLNGSTKALSTAETFSWNGKHGSQNTFFLVYSSSLFLLCTALFCNVVAVNKCGNQKKKKKKLKATRNCK